MLQTMHTARGRALVVTPGGALYAGRGFSIYRSTDDGATWQFITRMPCRPRRRIVTRLRLAARLLRHEVRALGVLSDGSLVAANRHGVYYAAVDQPVMTRATVEDTSRAIYPPMCITVGPRDRILWGEYDSRTAHGHPISLFVSDDRGHSFRVARTFPGGEILHIHNLCYDATLNQYWLLAGDHNHEPGIGLLSSDLSSFVWLAKGQQRYRAVDVFDFGDHLIYGMDSEKEANYIVAMDKKSGHVETIAPIEGSCIYAARFGGWYAISTTVEPSAVNKGRDAVLYLSRDGHRWRDVLRAPKDAWHARYFQYGSLVLPRGASSRETIAYSGQALRGLDGKLMTARCTESTQA
jgi:hypothetical protein